MRSLLALTAALVLLLCCGCSGEKPQTEETSAPVSTEMTLPPMDLDGPFIKDLVTKTYSHEKLEDIADFEGTNDELFAAYPIECQRDTAFGYRAMYLGSGEAAMVVVNNNMGTRYGYTMLLSGTRAEFETLKAGDPLSAVQALDKNGNYAFGFEGWDIAENLSWHATTDGYLIFIRYTNDYTIATIQVELL